jgi:tetratricopeptide (TPR) repeat protein
VAPTPKNKVYAPRVSKDEEPAPAGTEAIRDRNQRIREEAAAKRRRKRESEERHANVRGSLEAGEIVDDALARGTHAATSWLKRNYNILQWIVVVGVVGGIGYQIYVHRRGKAEAAATDKLFAGVDAEYARVGDAAEPDRITGIEDARKSAPDHKARLAAAEKAYRGAVGSDALGTLARLGLAGTLFDQGKYQEAQKEYQAVRLSQLASTDADLRCRAIEGVGLSEEGQNHLDQALAAFGELGKSEVVGFSPLGLYHQARIAKQKGERDKAKELAKSALEKLEKAKGSDKAIAVGDPGGFTENAARDLLASIDPSAVVRPSGPTLTPEQIQKLTEQASGDAKSGIDREKLDKLLRELQMNQIPVPAPSSAPSSTP